MNLGSLDADQKPVIANTVAKPKKAPAKQATKAKAKPNETVTTRSGRQTRKTTKFLEENTNVHNLQAEKDMGIALATAKAQQKATVSKDREFMDSLGMNPPVMNPLGMQTEQDAHAQPDVNNHYQASHAQALPSILKLKAPTLTLAPAPSTASSSMPAGIPSTAASTLTSIPVAPVPVLSSAPLSTLPVKRGRGRPPKIK